MAPARVLSEFPVKAATVVTSTMPILAGGVFRDLPQF